MEKLPVEEIMVEEDKSEQEKKPFKQPSTDYDYTSLASALNQSSNSLLQDISDEDLQGLHDVTFSKMREIIESENY
jgi:hypothetical protein